MAGFVDVVLRGLILVLGGVVLGGVVWTRRVLGAEPHTKPASPTALALRLAGGAALLAAGAQTAVLAVALAALADPGHGWPLALYLQTTFAQAALARIVVALATGALAFALARQAQGPAAWRALATGATVLVAGSAMLSHAMARLEHRTLLVTLDAVHQLAAAVWVGGLVHLTVYAAWRRRRPDGVGRR